MLPYYMLISTRFAVFGILWRRTVLEFEKTGRRTAPHLKINHHKQKKKQSAGFAYTNEDNEARSKLGEAKTNLRDNKLVKFMGFFPVINEKKRHTGK
jgi:hypothetical protein